MTSTRKSRARKKKSSQLNSRSNLSGKKSWLVYTSKLFIAHARVTAPCGHLQTAVYHSRGERKLTLTGTIWQAESKAQVGLRVTQFSDKLLRETECDFVRARASIGQWVNDLQTANCVLFKALWLAFWKSWPLLLDWTFFFLKLALLSIWLCAYAFRSLDSTLKRATSAAQNLTFLLVLFAIWKNPKHWPVVSTDAENVIVSLMTCDCVTKFDKWWNCEIVIVAKVWMRLVIDTVLDAVEKVGKLEIKIGGKSQAQRSALECNGTGKWSWARRKAAGRRFSEL